MCGICGMIFFDKARAVDPVRLRAMAEALTHRGPNDLGIYIKGNVGLGHTRLAVIDIAGGKQPMLSDNGSLVLIYNGEIYNFKELRADLESKGVKFKTASDTEVLLRLYEERGEECVNGLDGMFAFAVYDKRADKLFLARDRLGKKPLFYAATRDAFIFSSELKSLTLHDSLDKKISKTALRSYLMFRYVPGADTILEGVQRLEPATTLTFRDGKVSKSKYWSIPTAGRLRFSTGEINEKLDALMRKAVKGRMISDVPLGAFLSGGIDSSLIVALMAQNLNRPVNTFSIGFKDADYNELKHAREVSKLFGTQHSELVVEPDIAKDISKIIFYLDEPFADSSAIPTYYLASMARQRVTVALTGDGGDEVFGGYERYFGMYFLPLYASLAPRFLRKAVLAPLFGLLFGEPRRWGMMRIWKWLNEMSLLGKDPYAAAVAMQGQNYLADLLHDEYRVSSGSSPSTFLVSLLNKNAGLHTVKQHSVVDMETYLPGDLLVKLDRMTMAHSLEARSPFLDHHLVEFVMSLRPELVYRTKFLSQRDNSKWLLKQYAAKYLPKSIIRRRKMGFGVPISRWLRKELKGLVKETFEDSFLAQDGILRKESMLRILAHHADRSADNGELLWALLALETWYKIFMKRK